MAGFEIATASADDVARIMDWAKDEGWNPANTDRFAFHAIDPAGGDADLRHAPGPPIEVWSRVAAIKGLGRSRNLPA